MIYSPGADSARSKFVHTPLETDWRQKQVQNLTNYSLSSQSSYPNSEIAKHKQMPKPCPTSLGAKYQFLKKSYLSGKGNETVRRSNPPAASSNLELWSQSLKERAQIQADVAHGVQSDRACTDATPHASHRYAVHASPEQQATAHGSPSRSFDFQIPHPEAEEAAKVSRLALTRCRHTDATRVAPFARK